jgi:uncharacterized protein with HEPN domain
MKVRDDRFYLVHIFECIRNIEEDTAGGKESFFASRTFRDAVMRNLQLLAESAKRITDTFKQQHPEVPWRPVVRFRNVAVHDYLDIDYDEIWDIIAVDLPALKEQIARLLQ